MKFLLLTFLLSCSTAGVEEKDNDLDVSGVRDSIELWKKDLKLTDEGYLESLTHDCDGALWQGKWCAVTGCDLSDKYEDEGRFFRRPDPRCYEDGKDQGSKSTWSRDMFICGLVPWVYGTKNVSAIDRHVNYGIDNNWLMGEPKVGDDLINAARHFYTPNMRGVAYKLLDHIGGPKYPGVLWSKTGSYAEGLEDYHGHLQACLIWIKGEIDGGISEKMLGIVKTHHKRVPDDPFYAVLYGKYSGDWQPAIKNCTKKEPFRGDYVRCGEADCYAAHSIHACNLLLEGAK